MFRNRMLAMLMALLLAGGAVGIASAAEVESGSVYCFSAGDFSPEENLTGICITDLPESSVGTILLGTRVLREGDILTANQVSQMTFSPLLTEQDASAQVGYLPIYADRVDPSAAMTIAIRGKEDKAPVAEDMAVETYKNLPNTAKLKVSDPEGQAMAFTITRQPRRGTVTIGEDGSFTYTPKKNKVGVDSFTYTATDPAGKVSREATVTITILKPTDATQYTDTIGKSCRFAAEWMKHTGIFVGESVAENPCFSPEKPVTRGEFVTMLVKALEITPEEEITHTGYTDEIPLWLQPYLAAAVRSGLTAGLPEQETFGADMPITGAEAAVMLQNALDLTVETVAADSESPDWAATALSALEDNGITLDAGELTRGQAAEVLYQTAKLQAAEDMDAFEVEQ
ncbi:MAG: Ig-like domain-containing protein [Oscillospiraceae bacterium]|nr:Ig-like domain-containing protein [Oscillospiraceae bacterium]